MSMFYSDADTVVILCPLIQWRPTFLTNPYLAEDFTRINKPMFPEQAVSPKTWENLPDDKKVKRIAVGIQYGFVELFVYAEHDLFPKYQLSARGERMETRQHMVDFRQLFTVRCEKITDKSTPFDNVKLLQLSIEARAELRNKILTFFSRTPEEDKVLSE
ncbi:MAG: hypothetical protein HQK60_19895 [Deltaproteobacteria bacterium]|nr:hypothetical protein [Deltaproteobacteria bacterium]